MSRGNLLPKSFKKGKKTGNCMDEDSRLKFQGGQQKEFLNAVIRGHFKSRVDFSRFFGLNKFRVRGWITKNNNIPKSVFDKIVGKFPDYGYFSRFVEKELPWNWGWVKGGKACIAKIDNLAKHLEYARSCKKRHYTAPERNCIETGIGKPIVDEMISKEVDLESVLAVCLLTDGHLQIGENTRRISIYSTDAIIADFSEALLSKLSGFTPRVYGSGNNILAVRITDNNLSNKILTLSPEYRTFPPEGCAQLTIKFLKNKNRQTKIWAIRVAFTMDGSVSLSKTERPELNLACYNKSLSEEWQKLFQEFGIKCKVAYSKKSKQGAIGVRSYNYGSIYEFFKLGGFLEGVKISRKSKYYCGMAKNDLLQKLVGLGVKKGVIKI